MSAWSSSTRRVFGITGFESLSDSLFNQGFGDMKMPYEKIEGHQLVLDAFGHWPDFRYAEVRSLLLDRTTFVFEGIAEPRLDLCLYAFESAPNEKRPYINAFNHHLVHFRFYGVDAVSLFGFNHLNTILGFEIGDHQRMIGVPMCLQFTFVPDHGLSGSFCATSAEVVSVIPRDEEGRPPNKAEPSVLPDGTPAKPLSNSGEGGERRH